jgi:hypothetical protein
MQGVQTWHRWSLGRRRLKYEKVNGQKTSDGNTSHGELKNDEKRAITPRRVIRFTSKLLGM